MIRHLPGVPLCGFFGLFERDYGDPSTDPARCVIAPSRFGSVLLPFRCPRCSREIDFSDPARRADYRDARPGRGNYWCPTCGLRFQLDSHGKQVSASAPAIVSGVVARRSSHMAGIDILGDDGDGDAGDGGDPVDPMEEVEEAFDEADARGGGDTFDSGGGDSGSGFGGSDGGGTFNPIVTTSQDPSSPPPPQTPPGDDSSSGPRTRAKVHRKSPGRASKQGGRPHPRR